MNAGTPDETVTAHDVRTAQFTLVKRGGYDTQEVDAFLDQVAETLDVVAETQYRAPARPPAEDVPAVVAPVAAPAPAPAAVPAEAPLQLHDPDGAAQRLLAAAQRTSDALTAEAKTYAEAQRAEADTYAAATRGDADAHAARVMSTAEAQAATIRETAADEARRVAEATRASLVNEIERLETDRDRLMGDTERIRRTFEADRMRLLDIVDGLKRDINAAGSDLADPPGVSEPVPEPSPAPAAPAAISNDAPATHAEPAVEAAAVAGEVLEVELDPVPAPDDAAPADVPAEIDEIDEIEEIEEIAVAETAAGDAEVIDDPATAPGGEARAGTIFDIESDPTWSDDEGPPTEAMPAVDTGGDRFFDELQSSDEDGLGPLDDDTDAALTAFFESDDDDDEGWRRRFGGRG